MAGGALAGKTRVVHLGRCESNIVFVAGIAGSRCRDMPGIFAESVGVIVATSAGACSNTIVVISRWLPYRCRVAGIAALVGRDVRRRLGTRAERGIAAAVTG